MQFSTWRGQLRLHGPCRATTDSVHAGAGGDARKFLKENLPVSVLLWRGKPIGVELPSFIEHSSRSATGHEGRHRFRRHEAGHDRNGAISRSAFIKEGDVLRVDTRTGGSRARLRI